MTSGKSRAQLDREIRESLARGQEKSPMYTVQPRNPWRLWDFPSLSEAVDFGVTLGEPFDVSVDSGEIVWTWEQRGQQRHPRAETRHATKKRGARLVQDVRAETPAGYRWLLVHMRGATKTPDGFAVTDEEQWAESLAAAGAVELK